MAPKTPTSSPLLPGRPRRVYVARRKTMATAAYSLQVAVVVVCGAGMGCGHSMAVDMLVTSSIKHAHVRWVSLVSLFNTNTVATVGDGPAPLRHSPSGHIVIYIVLPEVA